MGNHRGGTEGYARQRRPSEVLLGATISGERVVEAGVLVNKSLRRGGSED